MASVIDSLLVELGLDASKFNAEQKKSVDSLRKFDEQSIKTNKNASQGAKELGDNLGKVKNALMAVGTAMIGVNGIKDLANQMINGNSALGRMSALLDINARELDAWQHAVVGFGGNAEGFSSSINNVEKALADFAIGKAGEETQKVLSQLNITAKNGKVDLFELGDSLKKLKDKMGAQTAMSMGESIGIDKGTLLMLMQSKDELRGLYSEFYKLSGVTQKTIEDGDKLNLKWAELKATGDGLTQTLISRLAPAFEVAMDASMKFFQSLGQSLSTPDEDSHQDSIWQKIFGASGLNANEDAELKKRWAKPSNDSSSTASPESSSKLSGLEKKYGLPPGMLDKIWQIESGRGKNMVSAVGATGHFQMMPSTAKQYGLSREDTMDFDKSSEAAAKMFRDLLKQYGGNIDKTLAAYNWGSGKLDKFGMGNMPKETSDYLGKYHKDEMIGARNTATGSGSGGNTSTTTIQNQVINTQATDANGIAKDIHKALQNNALVNYATTAGQ